MGLNVFVTGAGGYVARVDSAGPAGQLCVMIRGLLMVAMCAAGAGILPAQQVADTLFRPVVARPAYAGQDRAPVVALDEAHHNFHTVAGRYAPFVALLRRDGYQVVPFRSPFSEASLRGVDVLVIANPLHASNDSAGRWVLPTPSAFTDEEIAALGAWVERGGSLLLIADHMPFAGAAERLAAAFGIHYTNGFARDSTRDNQLPFRRSDGTLADHAITRGRDSTERVDSVISFTGSAFQADRGAALMTFGPAARSLNPRIAWQFDSTTARVDVGGWRQGATLRPGRGRVAAFGEAAMFSAQLGGPNRAPVGMNAPIAAQNPQFLLNTMHWLTGLIE